MASMNGKVFGLLFGNKVLKNEMRLSVWLFVQKYFLMDDSEASS